MRDYDDIYAEMEEEDDLDQRAQTRDAVKRRFKQINPEIKESNMYNSQMFPQINDQWAQGPFEEADGRVFYNVTNQQGQAFKQDGWEFLRLNNMTPAQQRVSMDYLRTYNSNVVQTQQPQQATQRTQAEAYAAQFQNNQMQQPVPQQNYNTPGYSQSPQQPAAPQQPAVDPSLGMVKRQPAAAQPTTAAQPTAQPTAQPKGQPVMQIEAINEALAYGPLLPLAYLPAQVEPTILDGVYGYKKRDGSGSVAKRADVVNDILQATATPGYTKVQEPEPPLLTLPAEDVYTLEGIADDVLMQRIEGTLDGALGTMGWVCLSSVTYKEDNVRSMITRHVLTEGGIDFNHLIRILDDVAENEPRQSRPVRMLADLLLTQFEFYLGAMNEITLTRESDPVKQLVSVTREIREAGMTDIIDNVSKAYASMFRFGATTDTAAKTVEFSLEIKVAAVLGHRDESTVNALTAISVDGINRVQSGWLTETLLPEVFSLMRPVRQLNKYREMPHFLLLVTGGTNVFAMIRTGIEDIYIYDMF